jgi:hypothetical protein
VSYRLPLNALHPAWEALPQRSRMGLSCDCPAHPAHPEDRPLVWFDNPLDGGEAAPGATATVHHLEEEEGFEHLTLVGQADGSVRIGHWCGWVVDGVLTESFVRGVAW